MLRGSFRFITLSLFLGFGFSTGATNTLITDPILRPAPAPAEIALRAMAEIDGDASTFTEREREKLAVLEQVMGNAVITPMTRLAHAPQ